MGNIDLLDDLFDLSDDVPPMNEALQEWAAVHAEEAAAAARTRDDRPVRGPCSMCRSTATTRCLRCERPVCPRHHHVMVGICLKCSEEEDAGDDEVDAASPADPYADERPAPRADLDLDWIE